MSIESLDDVRPGDIMIAGQSAAPAQATVYIGQILLHEHFRVGELVAGHAAVVVPGGKLVEAMPSGARRRDLRESDWSKKTAFLRLPEDYPGQALDAAAVATAMIDTPYSVASYAYLGLYLAHVHPHWLEERIDRRRPGTAFMLPSGHWTTEDLPVEAICSVLADQAWTLAGKKDLIRGTYPQVVTPGLLAGQLWTRPGVIRGGAGIS